MGQQILNSISGVIEMGDVIFSLIGILATITVVIGCVWKLIPAAWRFGLALYGKKIYVVSDIEEYENVKSDLVDSGLIREKNIQLITDKQIEKARKALLLIVVYGYLNDDDFKTVVSRKRQRCGLIVYCPPGNTRIEDDKMKYLNKSSFTVLCNFRGRMVNDVLLMMLSTSFKKADLKNNLDDTCSE
jgi:hypothetical protein